MASPMPSRDNVRKLLADLLARDVQVTRLPSKVKDFPFVADLIDDENQLVAICACDLPFSAFSASALCGVPAGAAKDAIKAGKLEQNQQENLREVMNILSAVFNGENMPHLRLKELYAAASPEGKDLSAKLAKPADRYDLDVNIEGYGKGNIALAVVR